MISAEPTLTSALFFFLKQRDCYGMSVDSWAKSLHFWNVKWDNESSMLLWSRGTWAAQKINWDWGDINVSLCMNCMMAGEQDWPMFMTITTAVLWTNFPSMSRQKRVLKHPTHKNRIIHMTSFKLQNTCRTYTCIPHPHTMCAPKEWQLWWWCIAHWA